jgi:hypothetical protein
MSVEPIELMHEVWTRWQGCVIHDVFPLGRFLGCSDHSGVFQTRSAALGSSDLAIKLVSTDRVTAQSQLPRWERAGGIVHPHLLRLLQWGECQLDGLPYSYVVMEYADQTLAQVLQRRALTDEEAREMLRPTLDALAFMHSQNLVQGQLKPANILVVGDQLKLASDTIGRVGEGSTGAKSTAGDVWAFGACLFEALTRRAPSGSGELGAAVALPADFSPAFRNVVARCLTPNPQNRPSATELVAWAGGQAASSAPEATESATLELPPRIMRPPAAPEAASPAAPLAQSWSRRALLTAALGAVVLVALAWIGVHLVGSPGTPAPTPALEASLSQVPGAGAPLAGDAANAGVLPLQSDRGDLATSTLHEVMPEVSQSVRGTIRGHIKVWVRITVAPDGSVIDATAERIGRNRYLLSLAIEAARKWTFPPIDTQSRRVLQLRFDFGRDHTTGRAVTLR